MIYPDMGEPPMDYERIDYELSATGRGYIKVYRKGGHWWSFIHGKWLWY